MLDALPKLKTATTKRASSWDTSGRNADRWLIKPGETRVLADLRAPKGGSGCIRHIWMTQSSHYRECLLKFTFDDAKHPSIVAPLGDFFCLGHGIVNSFQSVYFSGSSTENRNNQFNQGCALNCYLPMPFGKRAKVELVNESKELHGQYFYVDYETSTQPLPENTGYLHAEFRRTNPFGGWGHEVRVNTKEADAVNLGRLAWESNYVILETKGRGQYIGCNLSVTNFQGTWWGEGDDMIWVDGYSWPPDLHGTGSEDFLNQAWGMQDNAFLRNGSSIYEGNTNGYQTSYIFNPENPIHFQKEIKVTIEHGHANHLANEMSSVGYWYADKPTKVAAPPPVAKRMPVLRDNQGHWLYDKKNQCPGKKVKVTPEMTKLKKQWAKKMAK